MHISYINLFNPLNFCCRLTRNGKFWIIYIFMFMFMWVLFVFVLFAALYIHWELYGNIWVGNRATIRSNLPKVNFELQTAAHFSSWVQGRKRKHHAMFSLYSSILYNQSLWESCCLYSLLQMETLISSEHMTSSLSTFWIFYNLWHSWWGSREWAWDRREAFRVLLIIVFIFPNY